MMIFRKISVLKFNLIMLSFSLAIFAYGWQFKQFNQQMNCNINMVISNYDLTMPLIGQLFYSNGEGYISFDGPVYEGRQYEGMINRIVYFSGELDGDMFNLTGKKMITPEKNNLPQLKAERILPNFFVRPNSRISFNLRQEKGGLFFLKGNVPMFYCKDLVK